MSVGHSLQSICSAERLRQWTSRRVRCRGARPHESEGEPEARGERAHCYTICDTSAFTARRNASGPWGIGTFFGGESLEAERQAVGDGSDGEVRRRRFPQP